MTSATPQTFAQALAGVAPLTAEERADYTALALRLAADRSGAFFGDKTELARLVYELGAAHDELRRRVDVLLAEYDQPSLTLRAWATALDAVVEPLRRHAC